jgi:hypothetical protein
MPLFFTIRKVILNVGSLKRQFPFILKLPSLEKEGWQPLRLTGWFVPPPPRRLSQSKIQFNLFRIPATLDLGLWTLDQKSEP